jgi:3-dehydroquinate synthase
VSVIRISSKIKDYCVYIENNLDFFLQLEERFSNHCYVVDENVWRIYSDSSLRKISRSNLIIQPVSEDHKGLTSVLNLYDRLMDRSAKRNMTLISIGGGIVQDITGFVASTLYRGINWIFVPTTLLAQADSCIGSKTSLNYKGFKNLIGTFYPPAEVYLYPGFLKSLEEIDFFSGLGEVVKLHVLGGEEKLQEVITLLPKMVSRDSSAMLRGVENALAIKISYITEDEFDLGRRNFLNYGHCFGHALEATSDYAIPHGQAVVLGMILANSVAIRRGLLSPSLAQMILNQVLLPSLKAKLLLEYFQTEAVVESMKKDKKRTGEGLALIMINDRYQFSSIKDLTPLEAEGSLNELSQILTESHKLADS